MASRPEISVLIATHNRDVCLGETLEAMTRLDMNGIGVEWVVIDNNSTDKTAEVIKHYESRIPIRYLFEPKPGKNYALNKAISEIPLGDIVLFTDDDVTPDVHWLQQILEASSCHSNIDVFGGRVEIDWPEKQRPTWISNGFVGSVGFALHNLGKKSRMYQGEEFPFGPNFWVRNTVFLDGMRFNEKIGPRPKNRMMGSETSFLIMLANEGFDMLYVPSAYVWHRVSKDMCTIRSVITRAYRCGRSYVYINGLRDASRYNRFPLFWFTWRIGSVMLALIKFLCAFLSSSMENRVARWASAARVIGEGKEMIAVAWAMLFNGTDDNR